MNTISNNSCVALLIAIEYRDMPNDLVGCQQDALNMKDFLINNAGYNKNNITLVTDDYGLKPTRNNILNCIKQLSDLTKSGNFKEALIYYSGHGKQISDNDNDNDNEPDKMDEVIIPLDFGDSGYITDDTLHDYLKLFPITTHTICIFDCCNSASIGDLEYSYSYNEISDTTQVTKSKKKTLDNSIVVISGSKDNQTSNLVLTDSGWYSALTSALIEIFTNHKRGITLHQLERALYQYMTDNEIPDQNPVISSSWPKKPGSVISLRRPSNVNIIPNAVIENQIIMQNLFN